jgi:L-malate glycosyltransferase
MRILHLDSGRQMRGGQWQVLYLLRGLRSRGHEVTLLARRGAPLLAAAVADGFDARPLSMASFTACLTWAEILHAHDARTHTLAALTAVRTVVARRVAFAVRANLLSRWKYASADHYIAISEFVAGRLMEAGIKSEAITVVYDGVARVPVHGFAADGPIVAPFTDDPMKGSDLLKEAARIAGLEVRFSADLMGDLRGARLFAYISREEGLGSAALLAMAHGVPVLASRVGGLAELLRDGSCGVLVENDPGEIARGLRGLVEKPKLAENLGINGRKRAEEFSIDRMVDGTVRVYERVLANA